MKNNGSLSACMYDIRSLSKSIYNGFGKLEPVQEMVKDYTSKYKNLYDAANSLIDNQCKKSAAISFADAFCLDPMFRTVLKAKDWPTDMAPSLLLRIRMIQSIALNGDFKLIDRACNLSVQSLKELFRQQWTTV